MLGSAGQIVFTAFGCGYIVGATHVLALLFFIVKIHRSKSVSKLVSALLGEEPRTKKERKENKHGGGGSDADAKHLTSSHGGSQKKPQSQSSSHIDEREEERRRRSAEPEPRQHEVPKPSKPPAMEKSGSGGVVPAHTPSIEVHTGHLAHATTWDVGATISASNITDPVVRLAKQIISTEGVKEGWLQMRVMKKWRKHYFKLEVQRGWLSYYKNEQARSDQLIGLIKLYQCDITRKKKLSRKEKQLEKKLAKEGQSQEHSIQDDANAENLVIKIENQFKKSIFRRTGYDHDLPRSSGRHYLLHKFSKSSSCHLRANNSRTLKEWQQLITEASKIDGNMPHDTHDDGVVSSPVGGHSQMEGHPDMNHLHSDDGDDAESGNEGEAGGGDDDSDLEEEYVSDN